MCQSRANIPIFLFSASSNKEWVQRPQSKSSQQLVPPLSERVARITQEFYGSIKGQESMKDESQYIKMFKEEMQ
jgi:hypothetical protein